jgi:6-pyruvoyltetrahydropterin/6-carboxytetrahydropterin synthase
METQLLICAAARFEAARQITSAPGDHPQHRLHGHGFTVQARCSLPPAWSHFAGSEVQQLRSAIESCTAPLDHRLLNDQFADPTDARLAHWIAQHAALPEVRQLRLQSTPHRGVDIDSAGRAHLWRRLVFQSAHVLPQVPAGHKCGRMHGHGFEVVLHADASMAGSMALAHDDIDAAWAPLQALLDHACLNDLPGLANPTSEVLSSWIWARLQPELPALSSVTVYETASCGAIFDGQRYRVWKELTLDSAVQLRSAPESSALRRLHGHTYTLRLHLTAPLDDVLGWTIDFGDVKSLFAPIFLQLDHQPLHEIADLADGDSASVARWIFERARGQLPQLDRVDLLETEGCGAMVIAPGAGLALSV